MNHRFSGVAVHPRQVSSAEGSLIGIWLGHAIPASQRLKLMNLNPQYAPGHIGVQVDGRIGVTIVKYLGRIESERVARQIALRLMRSVREVTGAQSILLRLPRDYQLDYRAVSRALTI